MNPDRADHQPEWPDDFGEARHVHVETVLIGRAALPAGPRQLGTTDLLAEVIDQRGCQLGMQRCHATDWRTNVRRGAVAKPLEVDERLAEMARRSAQAVGAAIAGVDILPARDGRKFVLEVNAVPGWQALGRALELDVAAVVLQEIEAMVEARREIG